MPTSSTDVADLQYQSVEVTGRLVNDDSLVSELHALSTCASAILISARSGLVSLRCERKYASANSVSDPRPIRSRASRVQAPVDVVLNDVTLSLRSLDFRPTDVLDGLLAVEFSVEVPCEYEALPQGRRDRVRVHARTPRTPEDREPRRFLEPCRKFQRPWRMIPRQRSRTRVRPLGEGLTGACVYRGHKQMLLETSFTVKNSGLCTHRARRRRVPSPARPACLVIGRRALRGGRRCALPSTIRRRRSSGAPVRG